MNNRKEMIKKNIEYILIGVIVLVILLALIYALFIKKDNKGQEIDNYQEISYTDKKFTKLEKVTLTNENKVIKVNKKRIFVKVLDNYLYIDNKLIIDAILPNDDNNNCYLYYNDYLIFIYEDGTIYDGLKRVINENGEDVLANRELPFVNLEFSKNILIGKSYSIDDGYAINNYYVFKYDGKELTINEIYPEITKVEKLSLNNKNRIIEINNKKVNLKVVDNELYFNNKKIEDVFVENVYLTNYFIFITNIGQCDEVINASLDEDGNLIKINRNGYQIHDIRMENKRLIANGDKCPCEDDTCNMNALRAINYNGKNITIE